MSLTLSAISGSITRPKGEAFSNAVARIQATSPGSRGSKTLLTNELLTQFGILTNGLRVSAPADAVSSQTTRSKGKGKTKAGPSVPPVNETSESDGEGDASDTSSSSHDAAVVKGKAAKRSKAAVIRIPHGKGKDAQFKLKRRRLTKESDLQIPVKQAAVIEPTNVEQEPIVDETPDLPLPSGNQWKGLSNISIPSRIDDFLNLEIGDVRTPPPVDDENVRHEPRDVTPQSRPADKGS